MEVRTMNRIKVARAFTCLAVLAAVMLVLARVRRQVTAASRR